MLKHRRSVEADRWDMGTIIDYCAALILVVISLAAAEPPRNGRVFARQQQPPYPARGFRPSGPAFNLPLRSQKQQFNPQPPAPAASYGPPPQEYGPPAEPTTETPTTTESVEITTLEPQAENIKVSPNKDKLTAAPQGTINPASVYVVLPQSQNFIYSPAPIASAKLVLPAKVEQPKLLPVQAIPAFAKIQEAPRLAQVVEYQRVVPVSSAYTSIVNTPYSSTFVQSFQ
ncbi:hypothetical protein GWI33_005518 [Rhynchophorus ferrugineus]|uniref:Uncharacterized protein n=1 Tax=Rhynchophorus ferrugineus TaxID=354439 RepID=A0A834IKD7_RHYFE|nr:hypothetical protein GWI33_005518 [Rhynchophorus ferrugineus]